MSYYVDRLREAISYIRCEDDRAVGDAGIRDVQAAYDLTTGSRTHAQFYEELIVYLASIEDERERICDLIAEQRRKYDADHEHFTKIMDESSARWMDGARTALGALQRDISTGQKAIPNVLSHERDDPTSSEPAK